MYYFPSSRLLSLPDIVSKQTSDVSEGRAEWSKIVPWGLGELSPQSPITQKPAFPVWNGEKRTGGSLPRSCWQWVSEEFPAGCRHLLDQGVLMIDLEERIWRIDQEDDVVSGEGLLDGVGLQVDLDTAVGTNATREGMPVNALEPAIRIDLLRHRWQLGQRWKGDTRRLMLTRVPLMWPLVVVMLHELLGDLAYLLESGRPVHLETLLIITSMVPFDVTVFLWADASGQMLGWMPRQSKKRRNAEGKSRPLALLPQDFPDGPGRAKKEERRRKCEGVKYK